MEMVFFWVLISVVIGLLAAKRGRGSGNWFLISCLFSPIVGLIFLFALRDLSESGQSDKTHVNCPACAEKVLRQAIKCKHCGSSLVPEIRPETLYEKLTKSR